MVNTFRAMLICCMIVSISGCATMTIEGDGQKTPESKTGTNTVHGSFYSFVWSAPPVVMCEKGRGLYRVRSHTNAMYVLVSVISMGFYVPLTVEWWCDGTPGNDDGEEIYIPAK